MEDEEKKKKTKVPKMTPVPTGLQLFKAGVFILQHMEFENP